ncbi:MAG: hypothetical protein Fur0020_14660 [Thermodesulfovibrionia bacterium]
MFKSQLRDIASSLWIKFIATISLVLIFTLGGGMAFTILKTKNAQLNALYDKGNGLSTLLAKMSIDPVLYKDTLKIDSIVTDAIKDTDVIYALVYDEKDKLLNTPQAGLDLQDEELTSVVGSKPNDISDGVIKRLIEYEPLINISTPIVLEDGTKIGTVRLGLSRKNINLSITKTIRGIIIVTLSIIIAQGIAIFLLFRSLILKPFNEIARMTDAVAGYDLTIEIKGYKDDEIGKIMSALNSVTTNLAVLIKGVKDVVVNSSNITKDVVSSSMNVLKGAQRQQGAIDDVSLSMEAMDLSIIQVSRAAETLFEVTEEASSATAKLVTSIKQVAGATQQFSALASETASSVEEFVASIKEISESLEAVSASTESTASTIMEINASIKEVERAALESAKVAEDVMEEVTIKGGKNAYAAIKGIETIKVAITALSEVITRLGKRSQDIGDIVNVIDDIADQTNLLALNAAILSAEVGEHGKGFEVVANEIKALAERTGQSTKEIAVLIEAVQSETRQSVEMVNKGLKSVEAGLELVTTVNETLKSIGNSSKISAEKVRYIQNATEEQVRAITQITETISNINRQVEYISRATKEQNTGSRLIIEAMERVKELSQHVKSSTEEQSLESNLITDAIQKVKQQAKEILDSTEQQKEKSRKMVETKEEIKRISLETVNLAEEMVKSIRSLEEATRSLVSQIQRFKLG